MLFTVFLLSLLAQGPTAPSTPTQAEAVRLAEEGQDLAALEAFQARAAANPNDREARMWIARLHERLGHASSAEAVYRSVLLEDTSNVEAMVGVGNALIAREASQEAIEVLEDADRLSPRNPAVLAALGRAHDQAGHGAIGVRYLQLASTLAPAERQHRLSLEGARFGHLHWAELRGYGEDFDGNAPNTRSGELMVNFRLSDQLRVVGRGQVQRKFSVRDERGGAGIQWRLSPTTTFGAHALVGPSNQVLPEGDYSLSVDHRTRSTGFTGEVRFFDFDGASVLMLSPGIEWSSSDWLSFGLRYALTTTDSIALQSNEIGHTMGLSSTIHVHPRVGVNVGYTYGVENFENFSIDRIGAFDANTGSVGLRIHLQTLTTLQGTYEQQRRSGGIDMRRFTVAIAQRF